MNEASEYPHPRRLIRRRYKLLIYIALLVFSNIVRDNRSDHARPEPHHQVMVLPEHDGEQFDTRRVEMVYQDVRPSGGGDHPVVLLLHGSPMKSYDLQALLDGLALNFRVVAPELPGFGRSTRAVASYSFVSHAAYLSRFIDALGLSNIHVVAYSQGSGPALELYQLDPARIDSMSFVSAIGVQEFELLGNYSLNRAIHGVQLAIIGAIDVLVPHFGWLDEMMLNIPYARNFYDSDLRPLRGYLLGYEKPLLLIHGRGDLLVPYGSAQETHRLVPQSDLRLSAGGHIMVFKHPDWIVRDITAFIQRAILGEAVTRASADPARIAKAEKPFNPDDVDKAVGVAMVVMVLLIAFSTLISEDLACIGAGLLVAQGIISYNAAAFGAFLGIFVGDLLLFWAGHHWGKAALRRPPLKWFIKEAAIRDSSKWFAQKGPVVVLLSRFVPGSRLPTYFTAGMLHTRFWIFFLFFLIAGVVWAPLLVWLAMKLGQQIIETLFTYKLYTLAAVIATAVLLWLLFKIIIPLFSFKGRRLLLSRWRRLTHWEFWPSYVFYPPVIAYIVYLGVRYRHPLLFTAANPAIPLSGLIGESKTAILDGLKARSDLIARYDRIPANLEAHQKEHAVISFMDRHGMTFPCVIKPDAGQRGLGVAVIRNQRQLADYFSESRPDSIVQEYVPGFEFGVFYYRMPGQPRGHIYSITEKRFPIVVGDGKNDLEHLILKDPRAVCMAPFYIRMHDERRYWVPAEDESVQLVELGTHARGAVFHDGRWVKTQEIERAIDELSQGYDGFFFGRYDVRTPSIDEFRAGRGFKVIELNGVTAESTNMYNPGNGLFDAYPILFKQWHIAFKIGDRNRRLGVKPASLKDFFNTLSDYESAPEA